MAHHADPAAGGISVTVERDHRRSSSCLVGAYVLHYTRLGRNVYAIGGSEQSALLMGLPVARTTIAVYTISGFCSALGGVLYSFYTLSGYGLNAVGMELDAIAAVVIGGTLLTGGSGYLFGTVLGVLVLGLIQTHHHLPGHAQLVVDPDRHRDAAVRLHRPAAARLRPTHLRPSQGRHMLVPATAPCIWRRAHRRPAPPRPCRTAGHATCSPRQRPP